MKGYTDKVTLPSVGLVRQDVKQTNLTSVSKNELNLALTDVEQGFRNIPGIELISKGDRIVKETISSYGGLIR